MQWFKKTNSHALTAIRSSAEHTCMARVQRRQNAKPLVEMAQVDPNSIRQVEHAKTMVAKYKLKNTPCVFVLDYSDYQLLQVEKPNVPKQEQKQAVRWKLKDMIDYPVEQASIDLLEIPQDPANQNKQAYLYAAAAKNSVIGTLSNLLIETGVDLMAIDIRATAQRNIAAFLEQPDRGLAMFSLSKSGGLLTFTSGGELYHSRRVEIDDWRTHAGMERVALELQRSLDHFDRQFPFITVNKLLIAPFEGRDELLQHLKTTLYITAESFELSDVFDFSEQVRFASEDAQASLFPVLGAALREESIV